jgi:hypothetical protein
MPCSIDSIETGTTWMLISDSLGLGPRSSSIHPAGIRSWPERGRRWPSCSAVSQIEYGEIAICRFRLEVDGVVFGLVVGGDEEHEWATLEPDDLFFSVPWDGSYDT